MLITFSCKRFHDVTMFGDVGLRMLRAMGYPERAPGIIPAEEVPQALASLQAWLAGTPPAAQKSDEEEEAGKAPPVSLAQRALPLIEMLEKAARDELDVNWE